MVDIKVGCSGFYNKHWKGVFYPEKLAQTKMFDFYSQHFNTLELNVTFYQFPTVARLQTWYNKCPENFIFSVKAPRIITHYKKFVACESLIKDFYNVCKEGLAKKLGCVLFQLPPGIKYSEEKLQLIIDSLDPAFENVVEFRHDTWWKKNVYDKLAENNITFCSISHPQLPANLITNTPTAYVRLHGSPKMFYSEYSQGELQELHNDLKKKKNLKKAFVYFNNTAGTAGIINAQSFKKLK